jgi:glycerophosphoryl diester phosphodiesterase
MHPAVSSPRPLVFAHRGGSALAPENTLAAFDHGLSLGADGLEFDVQLSRDDVVVVHHDRILNRTTNASGPLVARSVEELSCVDAGYHFGPQAGYPFRGRGFCVPTLREVLRRYSNVLLIVELKINSAALGRAVAEEVRVAGALDRVCLGSFGGRALRAARACDPRIATSAGREEVRWALYRSWVRWSAARAPYQAYQVPEWSGSTRIVSPYFVQLAHRAGVAVHVWTVDEPADIRRLLDWGVDAIITDRPDLGVATVREWCTQHDREYSRRGTP